MEKCGAYNISRHRDAFPCILFNLFLNYDFFWVGSEQLLLVFKLELVKLY